MPESIFCRPCYQTTPIGGIYLVVFLGLLLSGCGGQNKLLKPNQYLLSNQQITGNQKITTYELEGFYKQRANRRSLNLPIYPYLTLYKIGLINYNQPKIEKQIESVKEKYDQKIKQVFNDSTSVRHSDSLAVRKLEKNREKQLNRLSKKLVEGNWLMRLGEPPVSFDSSLATKTAREMQEYLYSKGFFRGKVTYIYKLDSAYTLSRRAKVIYKIQENDRSLLRKTYRTLNNAGIDSLLKQTQSKTFLIPGDGYDEANLNAERERIDKLLKDNGYYDFNRQYITFLVNDTLKSIDTLRHDTTHLMDVETIINNPADGLPHKVYIVDGVYFTEDAGTPGYTQRDTLTYENIRYLARKHQFSRKVLNNKLNIRPGERYSLQKSLDTQRQLGSLDMFKFANIFYDTTDRHFTARIYASPLEKYSYSVEGGATVTLAASGYPGPFGSANFKIRNVFGGLEIFELRATGGIEGVAGVSSEANNSIYTSQQLGLTASLQFPQMLLPGRLKAPFRQYSPLTRVSVGYNFTGRPEFRRFGFQGTLSYKWQPAPEKQYTMTLLEISRIFSDYTDTDFKKRIDSLKNQGSTLFRAFQKAFVSSFSIGYTHNNNVLNQRKKARFLRLYGENGGMFLNIIPINTLKIGEDDQSTDGLQFYRFWKINADYRYYLPVSRVSTWAFRINLGIANPYGPAGTLPYEKFFFGGGSNSVRAWLPRRLGVGSTPDTSPDTTKRAYVYTFEQPGDILFEASAEYRNDFLKFDSFTVQIAFFADAGNVWLIRKNDTEPNGEFQLNRFYQEIALGAGMGLRFDFSFLILRLDAGTKVYDPGRLPVDRWAVNNLWKGRSVFTAGQSTLNFAIGYPF